MNDPRPMRGVLHELAFLRTASTETNIGRGVELAGILGTAREAADRYRAAITAHPDLLARYRGLFGSGARINGYIPPRTDGYGAYNPSPYRSALVELVREALTRENDWRPYDSDRLATVPERYIRAPWAELRDAPTAQPEQEAGLWHESDR